MTDNITAANKGFASGGVNSKIKFVASLQAFVFG